jgi:hypothetical protein
MTRIATFTWSVRLSSMVLAIALASLAVHAQEQSPTAPMSPPHMGTDASGFGNNNTNPHDSEQTRMMREMSRDRNELRQKAIVAESTQLLDLAKQLKDAVDKSSKDQLSLEVVNTATEIEKLAKSVKEKMRDGQ